MKPKILLIEDETMAIKIYESVLKKAGFNVDTLMLGKDALERLNKIKEGKKEKPDLVLLDLILPDVHGLEILKIAKKEKETKDIPFLILTNYVAPETKRNGKKFGAEKYIVKTDTTPAELIMTIKKHLRKKSKQ
ncbi:response regulator [Patescibacteria group bacterium]|nr:response regulator [Patescibacteria group bacterium]MBU4480994.1 response regulator [Patescibacteria group bacterium]